MLKPHQYGFKTVRQRTGSCATLDQRKRAKRYGLAHGYSGALGGWIYDETGQHVCHGWGHFWGDNKRAIVAWEKRKSKERK